MCVPAGWIFRFVDAAAGARAAGVSGFAELDAAWEAEMGRRGLAPATRAAYGRVARSYLVFPSFPTKEVRTNRGRFEPPLRPALPRPSNCRP